VHGLIDLASELVGGTAIAVSDDFFAPKENLLKADPPVFIPDKYTDRGKWMDGWESRRKRQPGHDWCVVRLGLAGILRTVDVDTSHFLGNFPSHCSLDGASTDTVPKERDWKPVLTKSRLQGGAHNLFDIDSQDRFRYLRLNIFPDGGVARLRVFGEVLPDLEKLRAAKNPSDLASLVNGGRVLASSDQFFGHQQNLILPGEPANMGGGWETRRRRGPGYDWIIVQLGAACAIQKIAVETQHYKGNYPDRCSMDACDAAGAIVEDLATGVVAWRKILPITKLKADSVHVFQRELHNLPRSTHVRLNIYPDGGISRLRVFARIAT
jgi:allantoicase